MDRKNFLKQTAVTAAGSTLLPFFSFANNDRTINEPLPAEKVKEFVAAGHNNLGKVKTMLAEMPTLLYATWDVGNGDFETALEGAGHVGDKEIAKYLIGLGARTNLFVLTMLGKTQLVKAFLELYPNYLYARGPHGLTLLHHAKRGGEEAEELFAYLQMKGLKEMKAPL
ncbi:MAG: ankyrin repeat domain-containing protein [Chitinophagaceae bacterium]|nr:MAG: ankyrin repeat domain-containing protein [Chitinophagaceae bacterium]